MSYFSVITDEEFKIIERLRKEKLRNPNYVLWNFDDNLQKVLDSKFEMVDRTNVGVRYLPGVLSEIDISERIPIPTRRKTNYISMLKEYLWFLTGSDNIKDLQKMGSKVWDFWYDAEWARQNGFVDGSIGYGYGPNLIHYGGDLNNLDKNPGFNQIDFVINELKTNPQSRRILFSFYRPDKASKTDVKLPSCHCIYQFIPEFVDGKPEKLSCCVYQRSSDMMVGNLSTNLQGASFYTYMIGQQVGMKPSKLYHMSGHGHIYKDHIPFVEEYLKRDAPNSPILKLNKKNSIYEYTPEDFVLEDYNPLPSMKLPIAV